MSRKLYILIRTGLHKNQSKKYGETVFFFLHFLPNQSEKKLVLSLITHTEYSKLQVMHEGT
jgi:hypothetical protein